MAVALLSLPLMYGLPAEPLRIVLGLLLVLFCPGYALVSALNPRREQLNGVERTGLGVGLSLALVPLLGLALNFTPWGIRLTPIVVTLSLWTVGVSAVAWLQRQRITPEERFEIPWASIVAWFRKPRRPADLTLGIALVSALLVVVGATAWQVQQSTPGESFTEFYVLGSQGMLQDYPSSLQVGEIQNYRLGIINREKSTSTYLVRAFLGNVEAGFLEPVTLSHEQIWEGEIKVVPITPGQQQRLEFRLYRNLESDPYRTLHLFIDVQDQ